MPRTTNPSEDSISSSSQVQDLLEQERAHFKALLQQQEQSYRNFTEMIMNITTKRVDDLMREVWDLKSSLLYTKKEVDDVKAAQRELNNGCKSNADNIHKLAESVLALDSKADHLETHCKQNNVPIDGGPETSLNFEEKVKQIFQNKSKQDYNKMIMDKAHRIGKIKSVNSTWPIPIMVQSQSQMDRAKCVKADPEATTQEAPSDSKQELACVVIKAEDSIQELKGFIEPISEDDDDENDTTAADEPQADFDSHSDSNDPSWVNPDRNKKRKTEREQPVITQETKVTQSDQRRFCCEVCGNKFKRKVHLTAHKRTHTGEGLHYCNICNKSFLYGCHLKIHKRSHTGERPYQCNICSKSFTQSSSLKMHKLRHSKDKLHRCDVCFKSFTCGSYLKMHKMSHAE